MIDLIHELKELLSKLETSEILGYIATKFITFASDEKEVSKNSNIFNKTSLDSPYKQYMYLAGLLMSTDYIAEDDIDSDSRILDKREEIYLKIEEKLKKITSSYIQFFIPGDITKEELQKLNEFEKQKRLVSMQVFLAYHNTDILRYEEQIISRLKLLAMPFNQKLIDNIGLSMSDFIAFYNFILNKYSESINAVVRRVREFYDDYEKMIIKVEKMSNAEEAHKYMLKRAQKIDPTLFEKIDNLCMICVDSIKYKFGVEKTNKFLDLFSLNRKKRDFTYYNSPNPFEQKPLCWIDDKRLFVVHPKIVLSAIYNGVQEILEEMHKQNKIKFYETRGDKAEEFTIEIFKRIFGKKAKYYSKVCEIYGSEEHDLLIDYNNYLLIVEIKSSKTKEPLFNPDKAYKRIVDHFHSKSGIGGGYKQARKLKDLIVSNEETTLFEQKTKPFKIYKKDYKKIYMLVITSVA